MQAGTHGETLHRVADRLRAELTDPEAPDLPGIRATLVEKGDMARILDTEDEASVARLRQALAGIASTLSAHSEEAPPLQAIETALDGAEFVIRGEFSSGDAEHVLRLVPSFVFLVALPVADQDRALALSRRAAELVERFGP